MKNNEKRNILMISYLAFALTVAFISAVITVSTFEKYNDLERIAYAEIEELRSAVAADSDSEKDATARYILRENEGRIGVFSPEGTLLETIDVMTKTLPAKDRQMLGIGISVSSREELLSIIQDYTS